MKINNIDDFVKYIRMQLGYPVINVELTDEQIKIIIDDEIQNMYSAFRWGDEVPLYNKNVCVERAYKLWIRILHKYPNLICNDTINYHYVLSKEHPNLIYVDVDHRMPKQKISEYIKSIYNQFKENCGEEYKIIIIPRLESKNEKMAI